MILFMSAGKITFFGITITVVGAIILLLVAVPLMFSALFYFIDKNMSIILFVIAIVIIFIIVGTWVRNNM